MTCTSRCRNAKGDECKCSCGGANHGVGNYQALNDELIEIILTTKEANPYRNQMTKRNTCGCGFVGIHDRDIYGYTHPEGWCVRNGCYWLWIHCPKCEYDLAIWKLGVPRDLIQKQVGDFVV